MYAIRNVDSWRRLLHSLQLLLLFLGSGVTQHIVAVLGHSTPHLDPIVSLANMPQFTLLYKHAHGNVIRQAGLPAPQGTEFEGPDPGLNAAIISAPEVCPNNYMKDAVGQCRPAFAYGPNPLSTFSPEKYKGSIQFYMGLQIGRPTQFTRRRNVLRHRNGSRRHGRLEHPNSPPTHRHSSPSNPDPFNELQPSLLPSSLIDSSNHHQHNPVLPTPPPLTEPVAVIIAILESLNDGDQLPSNVKSNPESQSNDDDDD